VLVVVASVGDACHDEWLLVVVVVGHTGLVLDEERRAEGDAWMVECSQIQVVGSRW
jgi:hypothetical protein